MSYTRGDNRKLIVGEARQHGWTVVERDFHNMVITRGESNIWLVWTVRDTLSYASINVDGGAGRVPAAPRMALVQARQWISA